MAEEKVSQLSKITNWVYAHLHSEVIIIKGQLLLLLLTVFLQFDAGLLVLADSLLKEVGLTLQ